MSPRLILVQAVLLLLLSVEYSSGEKIHVEHTLEVNDETCPNAFAPHAYPRQYISYKLSGGENIVVDGLLNDTAWQEIPFSESFNGIYSPDTKFQPRFDTKFKIRWDDEFFYVGAYIQETQVWANETEHDSVIFNDNDFEVFVDPDMSTHYYKELEANALAVSWSLMLNQPYLNGGSANNSWELGPTSRIAVYVDGPVNDPGPTGHPDQYWTIEYALPFSAYVVGCAKATAPPKPGDLWKINFSRVEYYVTIVNGNYSRRYYTQENWTWQPMYAINMHLPERWGYVQWSADPVNTTKLQRDPTFEIRTALAQIYNAQRKFNTITGYWAEDISQLELPSYVLDGSMNTNYPQLSARPTGPPITAGGPFEASVTSSLPGIPTGHINSNRCIWFDDDAGDSVCSFPSS